MSVCSKCPNAATAFLDTDEESRAYCDLHSPFKFGVGGPYVKLAAEIGALVEKKQAAYGDSFGKSGEIVRALYPNGIATEQLDDALAIVRIVDKLFRIATDRDALGESPFRDIAGYGLLGAARVEAKKAAAEPRAKAKVAG